MIIFSKDRDLMVVEPISAVCLEDSLTIDGVDYVKVIAKTISGKEYNLGSYEEKQGYDVLTCLSEDLCSSDNICQVQDYDYSDLEEGSSDGKEI